MIVRVFKDRGIPARIPAYEKPATNGIFLLSKHRYLYLPNVAVTRGRAAPVGFSAWWGRRQGRPTIAFTNDAA